MTKWVWLALGCSAWLLGCGGDDGGDDADVCPSGSGQGELAIDVELESGLLADVRLLQTARTVGEPIQDDERRTLPAGEYDVEVHRVRAQDSLVGAAYQGTSASERVCVRAGKLTNLRVTYTREAGSARLWVTQSNGDAAQVVAFDRAQLTALGAQTPVAGLSPKLENAGPV